MKTAMIPAPPRTRPVPGVNSAPGPSMLLYSTVWPDQSATIALVTPEGIAEVWSGSRLALRETYLDEVIRLRSLLPSNTYLAVMRWFDLEMMEIGPIWDNVGRSHPAVSRLMFDASGWRFDEAHRHRPVPMTDPVVVATDASAAAPGQRGRHTAWSWVTADGLYETGVLRVRNVGRGELFAIRRAVEAIRSSRLIVLTDSRLALRWIEGSVHPYHVAIDLEHLRRSCRGREVEFRWVKGHAGHPMNECADRLALQRRRQIDLGQPAEVADEVAASIVREFVPFGEVDLPDTHVARLGGPPAQI